MNIAVVYQSRGGNTKSVALAVASAFDVEARSIADAGEVEADLLFLGSGVYAASLDAGMKDYLDHLDPSRIGRVALFGTSAGGRKPFGMMKKRLAQKGITVLEPTLYIPGSFMFLNRGRPNEIDLAAAKSWAESFRE